MKANPDKLCNVVGGVHSGNRSLQAALRRSCHRIPYQSSGEMVPAVVSQQSVFTIADPLPTTTQAKSGQVRALAVASDMRLDELPEVPTMAEGGVSGANVALWSGVFAPAGKSSGIVCKLEAVLRRIMQMADVKEKFRVLATPTVSSTAADFAQLIDADTRMWSNVGRIVHVTIE